MKNRNNSCRHTQLTRCKGGRKATSHHAASNPCFTCIHHNPVPRKDGADWRKDRGGLLVKSENDLKFLSQYGVFFRFQFFMLLLLRQRSSSVLNIVLDSNRWTIFCVQQRKRTDQLKSSILCHSVQFSVPKGITSPPPSLSLDTLDPRSLRRTSLCVLYCICHHPGPQLPRLPQSLQRRGCRCRTLGPVWR